ncbi:MAG TPA: glycosyl hydrolase [Gammaproteobacteria bacterium]|nr:glycosyl hydrolase [Gammaproteobacteria bacterium]
MNRARPIRFILLAFALAVAAPVALAADIPSTAYSALHWRNIGPFLGGRSIAVAGNAATPHTFYFGATGGGIWKTTDGGKSWIDVSGQALKTGAVGALAIAPSDPNVIYAGMGESFIRGDMATGDGVYKSTDAGKTWSNVGLRDTHVISKIVVDPRDPEHVYVAALGHVFGPNSERGVYESTDGGAHWKKILYVNDKTGAVDLAIDPHNPRILFAAMWQAYRRPWKLSSGGPGSGLYKTTDGGAHWKNISRNPGMPQGILGKIGVSVSGADSNRVYAIVEAKAGGVFRSDDGGATWTRTYHESDLTQRAWYFTRIYADPKNVNLVYAPQVDGVFKSTDGGASFKPLDVPHGDVHVMWIDPANPDIMINGNDGGATVSYNGGESWSREDNQPTGQFYHVALSDAFPFSAYGAQQDRGSVEVANRSDSYGILPADVHNVAGGESGFVVPVPGKPWITYGGGYDGLLERLNRRTGQRTLVDVWPDNVMGHAAKDIKYRFQWTYPIMISRHAPHALYVAAQYVFRSTDEGRSWKRISPDLTRNLKDKQASSGGPLTQDNTSVEYYDVVFALAESPVKQGVLWAGSDDGLVHVSKDDGAHWEDVTPRGLPKLSTISIIEPSHFDAGTAFLAARRYRQDDFKPYLYKTTDYGAHWTRITDGLPDNESSFVIRQDTQDKNLLFAGTLTGVYVSFNGGDDWQSLQLNLPHVPVRDMAIQPRASALVLATHGRAFWVLDDLQPLREMSEKAADAEHYLFTPEPAYLAGGFSFSRPGLAIGENPPNGVVVYYDLKKAAAKGETVKLTFATAAGKTIASFTNHTDAHGKPLHENKEFYPPKEPRQPGVVPAKAGMNRFVWDLRYPEATAVPGAVLWFGSMRGPRVVPGTYQVTLTVGKASETRKFTILKDPRSSASQADLEAQLALLQQIHDKLDATDKSILQLRKVRDQINAYVEQVAKEPAGADVKKAAQPIVDRLDDIEAALIQTKAHSSEDPLNYPIRLNNKLAALAVTVGAGSSRPTQQEHQVFAELSGQVDKQLQRLDTVLHEQLPKLNALIGNNKIPPITVPGAKM